jgi:predicted PurR-regulated permease PerM
LLLLIWKVRTVLVWIVIALFFAVALYPVVNWVQRRLTWRRRSLATLVVFLLVFAILAGLVALFAVPLAREGTAVASRLPLIFARTVKLNPLTVLLAILIAVELAGILGALLAIPVAGMIQVVTRDLWDHRRGSLKDEPTVGEDRTPVSNAVSTDSVPAPTEGR